jgi:cobalt-zinc-cadmium resistance protein CzcA
MLAALVRAALGQRLMAVLLALVLAAAGVWAFRDLPIDAYPDISSTQVQVIVKSPGMGPLEVEERVTAPLETEVRGIPRLRVLRSVTKYALSVVTLDFAEGTDIYWARQQVTERIGPVLARLPAGSDGGLAPITSPLSEVFMFLVEGEGYSDTQLRGILDWMIRPRLMSVDGVAEVNALGGRVRSFAVTPDPRKLRAVGVTLRDVERALAASNQNAGGDRVVEHDQVLLVRTVGALRSREDVAAVTVAVRQGRPVHVHDVAEVDEGSLTRYGGVTRDGRGEGVQGLVLLRTGANGRRTVEGVKQALAAIQKSLPRGVRIVPTYDRTTLIERAVSTVERSLLESVVLVLVVLLLFLGNLRSALAAGLILPLTVLGAFVAMRALGVGANLMSLGGLAIAIGMLVDSAVVVVENIHRQLHDRPDQDRLHVVFRATTEVAGPVVASVVIIGVTFAPIFALTGVEGKLFGPLALTIVIALSVSLLLSLTVIPVVASLVMRGGGAGEGRLLGWLLRVYRPSLRWVLGHRVAAVGAALALLLGAGALFPFIGSEFIPALNEGSIVIQTEKLPSISLERSLAIDTEIQRALMKVPGVTGVVSRTGSDELRLDPMGLNQTDSFLRTRSTRSPAALRDRLRQALAAFPGVTVGFTQPIEMRVSEMLTGVRAAVAVKLHGDDLDVLERLSQAIEREMRSLRGAVDVLRTPLKGQRYLQAELRPSALGLAGVTIDDVNALVSTAVGGQVVTEVRQAGRRIPVLLRYPEADRGSTAALERLPVETPVGPRVLSDLAEVKVVDGPVQITREAGKRQVVVQCNVQGRDIVGFVDELRRAMRRNVRLPAGYHTTFGGQFENQQRASARLALVVPVALLAIFLLLFTTFGSVRQAGLILLNVPFALIGGIALLWASGLYLSVPASVGFIALFGTAVMNGVVLVNHMNALRRANLPLEEAVTQGAERRLRPVLMTSLLTILGLVPLLVATGPGSEIQRPLAVVVVGGMVTSTLLTLVLLPTLYAWLEGRAERRIARSAEPQP